MPLDDTPPPAWRPLTALQRRVIGTLVEKAKTTPDAYPLTLNALTTGCNQKNNRDPVTNLSTENVEETLESLREMGCVVEIQNAGRVLKYKHRMYEWLGVEKAELSVMTELLLRGAQTVGELRSHVSRMEPIADLTALQPVLDSLTAKKLVLTLTPEGRGQVVCHALYADRDLRELRERFGGAASPASPSPAPARPAPAVAAPTPATPAAHRPAPAPAVPAPRLVTVDMFAELQVEVTALQAEVARLRIKVQELESLFA